VPTSLQRRWEWEYIAGIKKKSVSPCPTNVPLKFSGLWPTSCLVWREHGVRRRRGGETEAFRQ